MKKKWTALALGLWIGCMPVISQAGGLVDENKYELRLGEGVSLKKETVFYEWGVQSFNILEMDLNNPALRADLIFNQSGFSQRLSLSNMVNQDSKVLAAVNGDFFSMSTPGFSIGPMMKEGKELSSAHYEGRKYAALITDASGKSFMDYIEPGVTVHNHTKGAVTNVASINKPSKNYGNIVILTKEYMKNSPGANKTFFDLTEVVVENDIVKEVRFGQPSVPIPEHGYVMVAGGANSYILSGNFSAGDQVQMKTNLTIRHPQAKFAIGGGTMIVKNSAATELTQSVKGKSQRSAVGITKDQRLLIVTVDGRKAPFIGMDEKDMQSFMLSRGVSEAMMLDGGGSTEMVADGKIQNEMAGAERPLVNGLAIKTSKEAGPARSIHASLLTSVLFQGEKAEIFARASDEQGIPLHVQTSEFQVSSEGFSGNFDGRFFTPISYGKGAILLSYGGVSQRIETEVLPRNIADERYREEPSGVPAFVVVPDMTSQDSVMDDAIKAKMQQFLAKMPLIISFKNRDAVFEKGLGSAKEAFNGAYKTKTVKDTTYISIDNRGGGIYKVKGQWDYLKGLLSQAEKNIVILLQGEEASADRRDAEAWNKIVQQAAKEKNVYVISEASSFTSRKTGYISYIGVPDYAKMSGRSLDEIKCLAFYEDEQGLHYGFKKVF